MSGQKPCRRFKSFDAPNSQAVSVLDLKSVGRTREPGFFSSAIISKGQKRHGDWWFFFPGETLGLCSLRVGKGPFWCTALKVHASAL